MKTPKSVTAGYYNLREIHGIPSAGLEQAVISSPAFRSGKLQLLCRVSPKEVLRPGDDPPERADQEWDRPLYPYLLCQGERVLVHLAVKETGCIIDPRRAKPPSGLLDFRYEPGPESMVNSLVKLWQNQPQRPDGGLRCCLSPLPERLVPDLIRLGLLTQSGSADGETALLPSVFGAECGLVKAYRAVPGGVLTEILCHRRTVSYLEGLIARWPAQASSAPRICSSLQRRMERLRQGYFSDPALGRELIGRIAAAEVDGSEAEINDELGQKILLNLEEVFGLRKGGTYLEAMEKLYRVVRASGWNAVRKEAVGWLRANMKVPKGGWTA